MKTADFQGIKIRLDRPKGFVQEGKDKDGRPWKRVYKVDYGFIPKTEGGDGDGIDVFIGPDQDADEAFWIKQLKDDGDFDEYKVILGVQTKAQAKKLYGEHIPMKYYGGCVVLKVPMMKAMLGIIPDEKTAQVLAFFEEVSNIMESARA
jgi:hypothetical protein